MAGQPPAYTAHDAGFVIEPEEVSADGAPETVEAPAAAPWWRQVRALYGKNMLLLRRRWALSLGAVLVMPLLTLAYAVPARLLADTTHATYDDDDTGGTQDLEPCPGNEEQVGLNMVYSIAPYIVAVAPVLVGFVATALVAWERRDRLLAAVINAGGSPSAYYVSWVLALALLSLVASVVTLVTMYASMLRLFLFTHPLVLLLLVWCATFSNMMVGLLLGSLVSHVLIMYAAQVMMLGVAITALFVPLMIQGNLKGYPELPMLDEYYWFNATSTCERVAGIWQVFYLPKEPYDGPRAYMPVIAFFFPIMNTARGMSDIAGYIHSGAGHYYSLHRFFHTNEPFTQVCLRRN